MNYLALLARLALLGSLVLLLGSCVEPYVPATLDAPRSYLVVDGSLNGNGVTTINLSRTYRIGAAMAPPAEVKATVYVQQEAGSRYALRETVPGTYVSDKLTLLSGKSYRLQIITAAGVEYASDYVSALSTPPIDELTWRITDQELTMRVSTHDAATATRYYRWATEETWEIKPLLVPQYVYVPANQSVVSITVPYPAQCWASEKSSSIYLANTSALTQNVVSDAPLQVLSSSSSKLSHRYSILVRQFAMSKEEYAYWSLLKKNTESIGSLFDPTPAPLTGNLHCLANPDEPVLGYIGVQSVTEKRLFIERSQLPQTWRVPSGYESCAVDTVTPKFYISAFQTLLRVPVDKVNQGVTSTTVGCVDCRTRGSAVKPDFWP